MKKICVITGSRAEYGLLRPLMQRIDKDAELELSVVATGMHLSPEFGMTCQEIENDGFKIAFKNEMLLSSDSDVGVTKSMGLGMIGFADYFSLQRPDLVVLLGDRFEIYAAATAAMMFKLPIAHLHGGEITEGAYDDAIRHCITKMSSLHFTSTEAYRQRVVQLGEQPERVYNVGALGVENIKNIQTWSREKLEENLGIEIDGQTILVTYHPVTLGESSSKKDFAILLKVLHDHPELKIIFTKANADTDGRIINAMIDEFAEEHRERVVAFQSLGLVRYLSVLKYCGMVVGNSSSGIIEVPSFNIPTINIGDRQKGRVHADSVYDCSMDYAALDKLLQKLLRERTSTRTEEVINPYEGSNTSAKMIQHMKEFLDGEIAKQKTFYDITFDKRI